jgi:hypothetical protein
MTKRENIVSIASGEVGTIEGKGNRTKYGQWYGMDGVAWCGIFVSWVFAMAGCRLPEIKKGYPVIHYVPTGLNYWRKTKEITSDPQPGDIVIFEFTGDKLADHIGIFHSWKVKGVSFYAIEGNTSADEKGSQANGGQVAKKLRNVKLVAAFVSPKELK